MEEKTNIGPVIFVGVIAILALVIAWFAFNRSGEDLGPTVANEARQAADATAMALDNTAEDVADAADATTDRAAIAAARLEARTELLAIQARLEAEETYDEAAADVAEVREGLATAYANASAEVQADYAALQADLEQAEQRLRDGTGDVLEAIGSALFHLEADVRTDEDA